MWNIQWRSVLVGANVVVERSVVRIVDSGVLNDEESSNEEDEEDEDDTEEIGVQQHRLELVIGQNPLHNRHIQLEGAEPIIKIFYRIGINIYLCARVFSAVGGDDLGHDILTGGAGHADGEVGQLPPGIVDHLAGGVV